MSEQNPMVGGSDAFDAAFGAVTADPSLIRRAVKGPTTSEERRAALAAVRSVDDPEPEQKPAAKARKITEYSDEELKVLSDRVTQEEIRRGMFGYGDALNEDDGTWEE